MDVLLIIDDLFDTSHIANYLNSETRITLFCLTSHFFKIEQISNYLHSQCKEVVIIESAKCINDEVLIMQKQLLKWSSRLANHKIDSKSLKEWFVLPDEAGSSWWFSLLSEKNAVQEPKFFQIAQINAIVKQMNNVNYSLCLIAVKDKMLRNVIKELSANAHIISLMSPKTNLKQRLLQFPLSNAAINLYIWMKQYLLTKRYLPRLTARLQKTTEFLFISYFPNIDNQAAQQGRFVNKYAGKLQTKLVEMNIPITWLLMPVYYNGHNYQSSMQLAKRFIDEGENLFVLQEFSNGRVLLKSLVWSIRQALLGYYLYWRMDKKVLTNELTHPAALPLIKYFWQQSFIGAANIRGMIFYLSFKEMLAKIKNLKTSLYYCEMQAWEKAFLMAAKTLAQPLKTLAFQHTVVGRNYYNYFYHPDDTQQSANKLNLPLPDKLIANGKMMYDFLAESQYSGLCQAEAIRQLYLSNLPQKNCPTTPILFVGGSCDKTEMIALLTMLHQAYPKAEKFAIWIKASPVMPVEPLFAELHIDLPTTQYKIFHSDVSELLSQVDIALIANTTVAIEAAAMGCPVIVPVFADTLLMNPIVGTQATYFEVSNVNQLKATIEKLLQEPRKKYSENFIDHYWNINPALPLWTNLLCTEMR